MKHAENIHVGRRVRHCRWMRGMTQQQLGDKAGVTFQQIHKYEAGTNRICASRMWDIAAALEVPETFFFEGLEAYLNDCLQCSPSLGPRPVKGRRPNIGRRVSDAGLATSPVA